MERVAIADLETWKSSHRRKPLILLGARQTGKTWLLKEFATNHYRRTVYLNLEQSQLARSIFDADLDVKRIVSDLGVLDGLGPIRAEDTVIILDEIQAAPQALAALKYFAEDGPQFHVAAAGSLLGIAAHQDVSFPVGKVNLLQIHPLSFTEYLKGIGESGLAEVVGGYPPERFAPFHDALVAHMKAFLFVGGMPEVVVEYAVHRDLLAAREVQRELLGTYERDFSKHAPTHEVPRLRALFESVPRQLARENKRFVYGQAQPGARSKTMEVALQWLTDANLIHKVPRVQVPRFPLAAYTDESAFKLYFLDVGLTAAAVGLEPRTILESSAVFTEYKGALTEQLVLQELIAAGFRPFYWANRNGTAEIDFLVEVSGRILPIEVKAEVSLQAKSLRVFKDQYAPTRSSRVSLRPYRDEGWLTNLPVYAVSRVAQV